jgi:hypothetical protein
VLKNGRNGLADFLFFMIFHQARSVAQKEQQGKAWPAEAWRRQWYSFRMSRKGAKAAKAMKRL